MKFLYGYRSVNVDLGVYLHSVTFDADEIDVKHIDDIAQQFQARAIVIDYQDKNVQFMFSSFEDRDGFVDQMRTLFNIRSID